jgi:hypothetical protein
VSCRQRRRETGTSAKSIHHERIALGRKDTTLPITFTDNTITNNTPDNCYGTSCLM